MNLKKITFISIITTFILAFLSHSFYQWFPNPIFSVIFPVNESIWEHMKMIYTTILLNGIIEYFLLNKYNIYHNNLCLITYFKSIISIPIYLIIFLPLYYIFGENMILAISVMLITIIIVNIIGYFLLQKEKMKTSRITCVLLILLTYFIMGILTYNPPHTEIFFDTHAEKYGINDYIKN